MNNLNYFLALNHIPAVGPRTVAKLLKKWPDLKTLFALSVTALEEAGLSPSLAQSIHHFDFKKIEADLRWMQQPGNHVLTWESEHYPVLLAEIHDPPPVLYAQGNLDALHKTTLAMVGTRKPSHGGAENARSFAKALAERDICIVSGLALGIDAQAHQGCLDANGSTIAILGTGIDCIYPRRHIDLAEKIQKNGLLLSEFPLKSPPIAGHFPRRNRIISGLSLFTLVIEAAIRSGSLITARFALEQNRDVLAIPGSIYNPQAKGCHHLLQQGARLVTSVSDILEALQREDIIVTNEINNRPLPAAGKNKPVQADFRNSSTKLFPHTTTYHAEKSVSENSLLQYMGFETTSIDEIISRSQKDMEFVTCELAMLELQGLIQAVIGGYMRCKL